MNWPVPLLAMLVMATLAAAEELAPVRVEAPPPLALRAGAPIPLTLGLRSADGQLRSGRLELAVGEEGEAPLATWTSDELVVDGSARRCALLLPAVELRPSHDTVVARLRWRDQAGDHPLPTLTLGLPGKGHLRLVAAVCCVAQAAPVVAPERTITPGTKAATSLRSLDPADLSEDPAAWDAWDLLVLDGEAAKRLGAAQRRAAAAWVGAGGALWLLGGELPAELEPLVEERDGRRLRCGLGRVVLGIDPGRQAGDLAHLWRVQPGSEEGWDPFTRERDRHQRWRPAPLTGLAHQLLAGVDARLPLGWILLIFALFALWITAGEFWLLRRWGLRRLTWFTLPGAALAAGGAILALTHLALRDAACERTLTVVDVGRDGRVLRTLRFTVVLAGTSRVLTVPAGAGWRAQPVAQNRYYDSSDRPVEVAARFHGMGRQRQAELAVARWSPVVMATAAHGGTPDASGLGSLTRLGEVAAAKEALVAAAGDGTTLATDPSGNPPPDDDSPRLWELPTPRDLQPGPLRGADDRDLAVVAPDERQRLVLVTLTTPTRDGWLMRRRVLLRDHP
ncbi:MAG: hypothetical protein L6R48_03075 [Planctomycetes bacterium]|nr:hypothetical protein [Planctomycetota bacterium]